MEIIVCIFAGIVAAIYIPIAIVSIISVIFLP